MRRINWSLLITIVLGLAVFAGASYYVFRYSNENRPVEKVLVAARDIPAYQVLAASDLRYRTIPAGGAEPGSVPEPNGAVNKMTTVPLYADRQIPEAALTEDILTIKTGERAIAVPVNLVGSVGNNLQPGDLVDVYWVPSKDLPGYIVAQQARVLKISDETGKAVLQDSQQQSGGLAQTTELGKSNGSLPAVAVLVVKNQYVPEITRTLVEGTVVLAKKNPTDITQNASVVTDEPEEGVNNNSLSTSQKRQSPN